MKVAAQRKAKSPPPPPPSASASATVLVLGSIALGAGAYLTYLLLQAQKKVTAASLARKAYASHEALTADDMEVVVSLIRTTGDELSEADRLALYRCVCCFEHWLLPTVKCADGTELVYSFPSATGTGFALCSSPEALAAVLSHNSPPEGSAHSQLMLKGSDACASRNLKASEIEFLTLDPDGDSAAPRPAVLDASSAALTEMAAAVDLEARLTDIQTDRHAARAFGGYAGFYCFAHRGESGAVAPLVSGSCVLLYTSLDLLHLATPQLKRVASHGAEGELKPCRVSMDAVLETLRHPRAQAKGVHVNRFIPRLAKQYKLDRLETHSIVALFELAGIKPQILAGGLSTTAQIARRDAREGVTRRGYPRGVVSATAVAARLVSAGSSAAGSSAVGSSGAVTEEGVLV